MSEYDFNEFLKAWKPDDKEWLKQRRKDWRYIQIQLDRMLSQPNKLIALRKKDYKFLKSYFLTGKDHIERSPSEAPICLKGYDTQYKATLLLQFWLSPDHSQECFYFLIKEFDKIYTSRWYYDDSYNTYKDSINYYHCGELDSYNDYNYKNYKFKWEGETTAYNGPLFGDLEPDMHKFFKCSLEREKKMDMQLKKGGDTNPRDYEGVFIGFLGFKEFETITCFNPNNPVIHWIDEYIRWGLPCERKKHSDHKDQLYILISTVWYVINTPEGRYPQQLEVAQELKQKILDAKKHASKRTIKLIDKGIQKYEKGKYEKDLMKR